MRHVSLVFYLSLLVNSVLAGELASPEGEVVLTISGNISNTNSDRGAEFDLAMLEELGADSIRTNTPWTEGPTTFTGVRVNELLALVGAGSTSFRANAFDNYWYEVEGVDFEKYPILVAYKRNDEYMTVRSLGPLWIMFPFDGYPELLTEINKAACVWQLNSIVVR